MHTYCIVCSIYIVLCRGVRIVDASKDLLIIGAGYCAGYIAEAAHQAGYHPVITSRNKQGKGIIPYASLAKWLVAHSGCSIVSTVAPYYNDDSYGDDPILQAHADSIQQCQPRWVGYLSATSVYGDAKGHWVEEHATLHGTTLRALARIQAEKNWSRFESAHIFRLAGIYGVGRSAIDQLLHGQARSIYAPEHMFNRIHVEDIAAIIMQAVIQPCAGVYNLADMHPSPQHAPLEYAADLLGYKHPARIPLAEATLSPMQQEFFAEHKRVDASKALHQWSYTLHYPDYMAGLQAVYTHMSNHTQTEQQHA